MVAFYGTPATIEELPTPAAAVNIASSTNATPIVITTSTNHELETGQAFIVNGHATNTNANGIWIAFVVDANEVALKNFDGTNSTGNGVGGATGTVQSLALPGVTLPEDFVTDIDAAAWNVPVEGVVDMAQWLAYRILAKMTILEGGTLSTASGSTSTFLGDVGLQGAVVANDTTVLIGSGARLQIGVDARWNQYSRDVTNADHTLNLSDGGVIIFEKPTSQRIITLEQSSDTDKADYDTWKFWMWDPPTVGNYYEIKREGSGNFICRLHGTIAGNQEPCFVEINLRSGVWRGIGGIGFSTGSDW